MSRAKKEEDVNEITTIEDAPQWIVDNKYLWHGYRKNYNSLRAAASSMFHKHNETMNVWTHLVGAIIFIICLTYLVLNFEKTKTIYNDFKQEVQNSNITQLLKESTQKISTAFKELDFEQNIANLKSNLQQIHQLHVKLLEETKSNIIKKELVILKNFNKKYDDFSDRMESLFADLFDNLKESSTSNINTLKERFDNYLAQNQIVTFISWTLDGNLEIYPIVIFITSAIICLGLSAVFHLFYIANPRICKILQKLDYAGISILNFGSSFSMFFYYFYCDKTLNMAYTGAVSLACVVVFFVSLSDWIDRPEAQTLKGLMYACLGLCNLLPVGHIVYLGIEHQKTQGALPLNSCFVGIVLMAAFYLIGVTIYILKFPERWFPKRFDIWMNSHTIWHCFVFCAAATHLSSLLCLHNLRKDFHC